MKTILIVEDDKMLNEGISFNLDLDGFNVKSAFTIKEANNYINNHNIDLIILDVNLPDGNGFDFCKEIRNKYNNPIVFLTACDMEIDVVKGFKLGADDYITKPFSLSILRERIVAILRRCEVKQNKADKIIVDDMIFDFDNMKVIKENNEVSLTPTENKMLKTLLNSKGKVLTRKILLEQLWDNDCNFVDEHALTVNINRIRNKIEKDPSKPIYLKTVYGMGYIWTGGIE